MGVGEPWASNGLLGDMPQMLIRICHRARGSCLAGRSVVSESTDRSRWFDTTTV
jgi:hypothetical protein